MTGIKVFHVLETIHSADENWSRKKESVINKSELNLFDKFLRTIKEKLIC